MQDDSEDQKTGGIPLAASSADDVDESLVRVSDVDRNDAVNRIQQAMATGHIGFEEIDERFEKAYSAKTHGELDVVLADLPVPDNPAHLHTRHHHWT